MADSVDEWCYATINNRKEPLGGRKVVVFDNERGTYHDYMREEILIERITDDTEFIDCDPPDDLDDLSYGTSLYVYGYRGGPIAKATAIGEATRDGSPTVED